MLEKVKENWKRLLRSEYLPLYVLFLIELLLHTTMGSYAYDDAGHVPLSGLADFLTKLKNGGANWSSRVIISLFLGGPTRVLSDALGYWVWAILNSLMILLLLWSISEIFFVKNKRICNIVLVCVFFFYPYSPMSAAGWVATTITYLWPAALAAYSGTLIKRVVEEKDISLARYVTCFFAAVCACNSEQLSVVMLVLTAVLLGYCLTQRKRAYSLCMLTGIAFINVILHFTSNGNHSRLSVEIRSWYPGYMMLSLVERLQLGFSETVSRFVLEPNLIYLLLILLICWSVWHKNTGIVNRVAVAMPLLFCTAYGFLPSVAANIFPPLKHLADVAQQDMAVPFNGHRASLVTINNFTDVYAYIPLFVMLICFFITIAGLFLAIENPRKALIAALIFCCGIGSGMIMGFSPTINTQHGSFAFGRSFLYAYVCCIISTVIVAHENLDLFTRHGKGYFVPALASVSSISLIAQVFWDIAFYFRWN